MTASICPTITTDDPHEYRRQLELVSGFASRVHIDVADGKFTPNKLLDIDRLWWPSNVTADIHVMYEKPFEHTDILIALKPHLIIVHAEAQGQFVPFADELHQHGINTGIALLPETPVSFIAGALDHIDHVLIFSGNIGHFGGTANLELVSKALELKSLKPSVEIGWDGGVNTDNAKQLAQAGIDVLNTGGYIHRDAEPSDAYRRLLRAVQAETRRVTINLV